jgi:predicted metalloprotease with PDZ domain
MSRLAPLVDGSSADFPKYWNNDFVSYYGYGDAIALGLDLTLRVRSDSRITLDDFMRAMWRNYGKPAGSGPGLVGRPYTIDDVQVQLAAVSGDPAFAADFVKRYIVGTEKLDYAELLRHAGLVLRKQKGVPSLGVVRLTKGEHGPIVSSSTIIDSPAYKAGIDLDDEIVSVAGTPLTAPEDLPKVLGTHRVGDSVEVVFRRRGQQVRCSIILSEPTDLEVVTLENTGASVSPKQKQFRDAWLSTQVK